MSDICGAVRAEGLPGCIREPGHPYYHHEKHPDRDVSWLGGEWYAWHADGRREAWDGRWVWSRRETLISPVAVPGPFARAEARMRAEGWNRGEDEKGNRYYFPPEDQDDGYVRVVPAGTWYDELPCGGCGQRAGHDGECGPKEAER